MGEREDLCGRMVGEFVLRERIDEGGFGDVYRCEQPLLGREAVVKVLHQRLRRNDVVLQRFMREAQLASRLDHPYAAHVYAFGIEHDDGLFWIAMEMVQGTTLNRWLRERGPLPLAQFVPFFERVAEVVQTAHDRGIVHRDIKPSNVMVIERAGRLLPKLLDFGVAKLLDDALLPVTPTGTLVPNAEPDEPVDGDRTASGRWRNPSEVATLTGTTAPPPRRGLHQRLTHADATVGSPPYMSPEQWSNALTVGPGSDLYALGVVAYEALTGRRPFNAGTLAEYVDLHCNAAVPPLGGGFSPALDRLFTRALAKRPEDRWASALELAAAFRSASGLGTAPSDLPRLDETVRDAWLSDAPQPLAESIAALDGARNAHQARDAAQEMVRNLVRYLLALALATRAQVREDRGDPALLELVRTMRRRDLRDDERVRLLRLLARPLASRRGAHPIPELVDLVTPGSDDGADGLDPILSLYAMTDFTAAEDIVRMRLARLVPELAHLLRKTAFVLDYVLVVPRNGVAERWTGLRRQHRALATVRTGELSKHHPMLLDRDAKICVDLWPLMQAVSPTEGADPELFLFDGRGRHGARMVASPGGFEHHDPSVWEWLAARVIAEIGSHPEVGDADHPPYLGLTPFSTSDAARFVGREWEVDAFLNRLRQRALQVVVGPSGAGKSSFVHAGVIPGLPASWRTVTMRPGGAPLGALSSRLAAANITTTDVRPMLETSPAAVAAMVARAAAGGTIVFVIDQLEELFTLCSNAEERVQFAAVIAALAASVDAPIRVICAIRDDFLMQLDGLAPLRPQLSPALLLLGNPSRDALVRIVVEPARRVGYTLSDPELAHDMVDVVADRPGALALLSFTASRLWELRDRRFCQLTRKAYDAMGGVGGALGKHAEATLDRFSADEQPIVRQIFRHLITADGTRALLTAKELRQRLATPSADAVIDKLVAARLIAISESDGEPHVEVIHDALIGAWPRLQEWIREDVDGARMRDQIRTSARQWHDRGEPRGLLWREEVLADLERWMRRRDPVALSELETAFVDASRRHARRATRTRRVLVAVGIAMIFAVILYRAKIETRLANEFAEERRTQSYVVEGRHLLLEGDFTTALIYLARAHARGDESSSVTFMLARAMQPRLGERSRLPSTAGRMWSAMFSRDGQQIVTTDDKSARVWDARTYTLQFTLAHDDTVYDAAYTPDGTRLVTAGADGFVKVWSAGTGLLVRSMGQKRTDGSTVRYYRVVVSPDGTLVAAVDSSGAYTHVWETLSGTLVAELANAEPGQPSLAFSRDGKWLATSGADGVQVFDTASWQKVVTLPGRDVSSLSFDPTAARLATATAQGDASVWSIPNGERQQHLHETGTAIHHLAYSPDGAYVVAASEDGTERVWNATTGRVVTELKNHVGAVLWAEFDPASALVVSAGVDGKVSVSDIASQLSVSLHGGGDRVVMARFDPTSQRVVGASRDGTARVWDAASPYRRWNSPAIGDDCGGDVSIDQDRRFIAINCTDHGVFVWDTARNLKLAQLPKVTPVTGDGDFESAFPAVSENGDLAAIAHDSTVVVSSLPGGGLVRTISHTAAVNTVAFARNGHDLVTGSIDGMVQVTRDNGDPTPLPAMPGGVDVVGFTADNRILAAGPQRLRVYDGARGTLLRDLPLPSRVRAFRQSADGKRLITIPTTASAVAPMLWDLEDYGPPKKLEGHKGQVFSARFVANDRQILTAGSDGTAQLWDGFTAEPIQKFRGTAVNAQFLLDAALSPDGSQVVTAGGDGLLRFWDVKSRQILWTMRAHRTPITGIHYQDTAIVTRSFTGEFARWELAKLPTQAVVDRLIRCLPSRLDDVTEALVEQPPCDTQ